MKIDGFDSDVAGVGIRCSTIVVWEVPASVTVWAFSVKPILIPESHLLREKLIDLVRHGPFKAPKFLLGFPPVLPVKYIPG